MDSKFLVGESVR